MGACCDDAAEFNSLDLNSADKRRRDRDEGRQPDEYAMTVGEEGIAIRADRRRFSPSLGRTRSTYDETSQQPFTLADSRSTRRDTHQSDGQSRGKLSEQAEDVAWLVDAGRRRSGLALHGWRLTCPSSQPPGAQPPEYRGRYGRQHHRSTHATDARCDQATTEDRRPRPGLPVRFGERSGPQSGPTQLPQRVAPQRLTIRDDMI